jgi:hypothetical protein
MRSGQHGSLCESQVKQLAWDGHVYEVCSLGGGPPAALAGALADRLLVARGSGASGTEVSARHVSLLPCLLLGWASLASCAILPGVTLPAPACDSFHTLHAAVHHCAPGSRCLAVKARLVCYPAI